MKQFLQILFVFWLSINLINVGTAKEFSSKEQAIKAVFLYSLVNFVIWPDYAFYDKDTPYNICTLSDGNFHNILELSIENKKATDGRAIKATQLDNLEKLAACHILFIDSIYKSVYQVLPLTQDYPILIVGEHGYFVEMDGGIQFYKKDKKIHLKINYLAIKKEQLIVVHNLLRISKIVETDKLLVYKINMLRKFIFETINSLFCNLVEQTKFVTAY